MPSPVKFSVHAPGPFGRSLVSSVVTDGCDHCVVYSADALGPVRSRPIPRVNEPDSVVIIPVGPWSKSSIGLGVTPVRVKRRCAVHQPAVSEQAMPGPGEKFGWTCGSSVTM